MHVYKFKVILEDVDDFIREIEIMPNQTFEDFHFAILKSVGIEPTELASFFICDSVWKKKKEITLTKMHEDSIADEDDEDEKKAQIIPLMSECVLLDYIDDPHKRMMYIYDYLNYWTFFIELSKILPAEKKVQYPRCVKSMGEMPKKTNVPTAFIPNEFSEEFSSEEVDLKEDLEDIDEISDGLDGIETDATEEVSDSPDEI